MNFDFNKNPDGPSDLLFLERLDTFMQRNLADLKAFADREFRSFDETRRLVAEWHSKYLFKPSFEDATLQQDNAAKVRSVLCDVSNLLESLFEIAGIQSFVLAVDPLSASDAGFLGGTVVGREYWRGLRGGGDAGAKGFKAFCLRDLESSFPQIPRPDPSVINSTLPAKLPPARSLKTELYDGIRKALRTVSGVRNAEMKWTNPERLDVYGVRLVGWPAEIPPANPSSLKVFQNKVILDCLDSGTLRFEKLFPEAPAASVTPNDHAEESPVAQESGGIDDFSWAYNPNADDAPIVPAEEDETPPQAEQPIASQPPDIEDTFWQAPEDPSLTGDLWGEIDMATILQSTLDSSSSQTRKRPRIELEFDDIP
ncbi:hypothetical protein H0H87_005448 [Tephrocybe sp. NHM501043]|nr:hypothetical protein H0H87_005448 [Tephrocybe sp. NHM501043]